MRCLELGAADFITKPGGSSVTLKIGDVSDEIIEYVSCYGASYAAIQRPASPGRRDNPFPSYILLIPPEGGKENPDPRPCPLCCFYANVLP